MDIFNSNARTALVLVGLIMLALRPGTGVAASAIEIDIKTDATLKQFAETVAGAQVFLNNAKGVLVFPSIFRAGFVFGAQYGEGALRIDGRTADYYNTIGGSFGFQLGAQTQTLILVFLEQNALDQFRRSAGWEVGVDGSVVLVELGAAASVTTITARDPIVAFVFDNKGLMYNLSLEGTKFTRLNKKRGDADTRPATAPAPAPSTPAEPVVTTPESDAEDEGIILRRP